MIRIQPIRQAKKRGDGLQNRGTGRSPGSPVEHGSVGELHAAFLTESRTRSRGMAPRTGDTGPGEASLNGVPRPFSAPSDHVQQYANRSSRLVQIRPGNDRNSALERDVIFREVYS
jgi:hypothetical protein